MEPCFVSELKHQLKMMNVENLHSVYFGGGTPSLARPQLVEKILQILVPFGLGSKTEVTVEMNPSSAETRSMQDFQRAGVNRISVGVQSLRDDVLRSFGRDHSVGDALTAIENAKALYANFSLDFIYGRPNQTLDQWRQELEQILSLGAHHLSLYNLILERGTPLFKDVTEKKISLPDADVSADMYELTVEVCPRGPICVYIPLIPRHRCADPAEYLSMKYHHLPELLDSTASIIYHIGMGLITLESARGLMVASLCSPGPRCGRFASLILIDGCPPVKNINMDLLAQWIYYQGMRRENHWYLGCG